MAYHAIWVDSIQACSPLHHGYEPSIGFRLEQHLMARDYLRFTVMICSLLGGCAWGIFRFFKPLDDCSRLLRDSQTGFITGGIRVLRYPFVSATADLGRNFPFYMEDVTYVGHITKNGSNGPSSWSRGSWKYSYLECR